MCILSLSVESFPSRIPWTPNELEVCGTREALAILGSARKSAAMGRLRHKPDSLSSVKKKQWVDDLTGVSDYLSP